MGQGLRRMRKSSTLSLRARSTCRAETPVLVERSSSLSIVTPIPEVAPAVESPSCSPYASSDSSIVSHSPKSSNDRSQPPFPERFEGIGLLLDSQTPLTGGLLSDVYKGTYQSRPVAVKAIRVWNGSGQRTVYDKAKELCRLSHPNLVPLLEVLRSQVGVVLLLFPWMPNGTVLEFAKQNNLDESGTLQMLVEVASGLTYLHSEDIVHGKVKAANALVDLEKHARLADFGLEYVVQQAAGTSIPTHLRWNAPELLRLENTTVETPATDVYSLGILFWEVYARHRPFDNINSDLRVVVQVVDGVRPTRPGLAVDKDERVMPDELWTCIQKTWAPEPEDRPSSGKLLKNLQLLASQNSALSTSLLNVWAPMMILSSYVVTVVLP